MTVGNVNGMAESLWQGALGLPHLSALFGSLHKGIPGQCSNAGAWQGTHSWGPALQGGLTPCARSWRCCVLSNCDLGNDSELLLNPILCCAFHYPCHLLYSPAHFEAGTALPVALAGPELWCHYSFGAHLQDDSSSGPEQRSPKHPQECQGSGGSWGRQQNLSAGTAPL